MPARAVDLDQLAPRQALFPFPGIDTLPADACLRPEWASAMIGTLNELGGHGKVERCGGVSTAQRSALGNVAQLCNGVPDCPVDDITKGAMKHICGSSGGYVDDGDSATHTLYQRKRVSLPSAAGRLKSLVALSGPRARAMLMEPSSNILRTGPSGEFSGKLAFDGRLKRSPVTYGRFLGDLWKRGLLTVRKSFCTVTPFFVPKKDGSLRLIFDTRLANTWCLDSPYTSLTAIDALASVITPEGSKLHKEQCDVVCCFYQFGIPEFLLGLFGLAPILHRALPKWLRGLVHPDDAGYVSFCLTALPMGWS